LSFDSATDRAQRSAATRGTCKTKVTRAAAQYMEVQIFGVKKSADTRKALRFFAERRVKTHFVDLQERAASLGELRRFAQKFGVEALLDRESKRFAELGLRQALYSPDYWLNKLVDEPLMLRVPLVRNGSALTIGYADVEWKTWVVS
jgi:arsenate reductase-like glutaredoxin family protein